MNERAATGESRDHLRFLHSAYASVEMIDSIMSENIKNDFPIFTKAKLKDKSWVYLDSAATTQKPKQVISAVTDWYEQYNANIHRGVYELSEKATQKYEESRQKVADFIGSDSARQIIFTRGTTEGINLVAQAWGRENLKPGDTIMLTEMEHHANIVPWQQLAKEKGLKIRYWPIDKDGKLILSNLEEEFKDVKLVSLVYVSNVLGTINPVSEIINQAHKRDIPVLLDAAQAVGHLPVDVDKLDVDWLAFSGHKMLGPTGIGVLYVKQDRFKEMGVYQTGGDMIKHVTYEDSTFASPPTKYEAGTQNMAGAIGLAAAVDYLNKLDMDKVVRHDKMMVAYAFGEMQKIPEVIIYGPKDDRAGVITFTVKGIHAHDLATLFDEQSICIRAGHHCAQPLHDKLGISASARVSFYIYNDKQEVDYFIKALREIIKKWQASIGKK